MGRELGGKVGRVTGLDPAAPFFAEEDSRIGKDSGLFVDVIHTTAAAVFTTIADALGHADFYPNGERGPQPGCAEPWEWLLWPFVGGGCSHIRAAGYYAESIEGKKTFEAR
jgi:hypothetical protein